ncbi:metallophosphoesterase [Massilia sp. CCM 8734]|uniref:metallophosphoesterase n=1 Tax=Massilia sp. CCM 8734 TaxID=2609283 RepID=UPI001E4F1CF1|nr:metallophosphoesterase [Massilia sp. CCM 8734]
MRITPSVRPSLGLAAASLLLLAACSSDDEPAAAPAPAPIAPPVAAPAATPSVAFMTDVHFEDVYGDFKSAQFSGIPTKDGKNATIRTMYAQLTSTRLFNENYFAFRAALDDAFARGIRLVALPGDYSDDAQPININGISAILHEYQAKGMRFFIAPGNHDPNEPYDDDEAGKSDFLTRDGKEQKVFASGNAACKAKDPTVVCTNELLEMGYEKLIAKLSGFGYMPNKADLHWETPFSNYPGGKYSYAEAMASGDVRNRQFEMCAEGEGGMYRADGEKPSASLTRSAATSSIRATWSSRSRACGCCRSMPTCLSRTPRSTRPSRRRSRVSMAPATRAGTRSSRTSGTRWRGSSRSPRAPGRKASN